VSQSLHKQESELKSTQILEEKFGKMRNSVDHEALARSRKPLSANRSSGILPKGPDSKFEHDVVQHRNEIQKFGEGMKRGSAAKNKSPPQTTTMARSKLQRARSGGGLPKPEPKPAAPAREAADYDVGLQDKDIEIEHLNGTVRALQKKVAVSKDLQQQLIAQET